MFDDQVRFWPRSAAVEQDVDYEMTVYTHCGLDYLFDFDTSFWLLASGHAHEGAADPVDEGVIRLVSDDEALYTSSLGYEFDLTRHEGPKDVFMCE